MIGWRVVDEERLEGGNLSGTVVRIGNTVRRPTGPWTPAVHALLRHLEERGFDGAPRVHGLDDDGREILDYIEGEVAWAAAHRRLLGDLDAVSAVGALLRAFHDAVADFDPGPTATWRFPEMAPDAEPFVDDRGVIVCHNDPAAWNLVIGEDRWAFIDWDTAGPRPPIWDVAYCAVGVVPISETAPAAGWDDPIPTADRLSALADGYGLSRADRERLPAVVVARIESSYRHLRRRAEAGIEPWRQMWLDGHGDSWRTMLDFARANEAEWLRRIGP